jgi:hypothetical protein
MKISHSPSRNASLVSLLAAVVTIAAGACSSSTPDGSGGTSAPVPDASTEDTGSTVPIPKVDSGFTAPPADAAAPDASLDSAAAPDTSSGVPEAAPAATCGAPPARFTLLSGADAGLVRDNVTELVWMTNSVGGGEPPQTQSLAATYCTNRNMRLPTKDEAVALASNYVACAFGEWSTWTSTTITGGDAWVIDYLGEASPQVADNFPSAVLCVRDPGGG